MKVFKGVRERDQLLLVEFSTSAPESGDLDRGQYAQFVCADPATIVRISEVHGPCDEYTLRELPPWVTVRGSNREYRVNRVLRDLRVSENAAAAVERKWTPSRKATGPYVRRTHDGQILVRGQYRFGYPDGVWVYYDEEGRETNRIVHQWQVETAMEQAVKEQDVMTMFSIIRDNWDECYGRIPGFRDRLETYVARGSRALDR